MGNIGAKKMFALVVDSETKEPRRMIDTSGDPDDSYLLKSQQNVAADETIVLLPLEDYPVRKPYEIAAALGYQPDQARAIDDTAQLAADAEVKPLAASLSKQTKSDLAARVRELFKADWAVLPRDDAKTIQILAKEATPEIAAKLLSGTPAAPIYARAIVMAIWDEITPYPASA